MKFPTYEKMAKDVAEKAMDDFLFNGKSIREWAELIIDLGIPENPTNGDVIKAMFPNYYQTLLFYLDNTRWWNAPWKGWK